MSENLDDYHKFMSVFDNRNILPDCTDLPYHASIDNLNPSRIQVVIDSLEVGFVFDRESGRLLYAYNWKE